MINYEGVNFGFHRQRAAGKGVEEENEVVVTPGNPL